MNIVCCVSDNAVFQQIQAALKHIRYEIKRFSSDVLMLSALRRQECDLIFVEIQEGVKERANIFSWLNCTAGNGTPVILLTQSYDPRSVALALESGADDCIVMPCDQLELTARINVVLRRSNRKLVRRSIEMFGFSLNQESGECVDRGRNVQLTRLEFAMAWLFFSTPGVYLSREKISASIWGVEKKIANRTIEQHVYKLRRKLALSRQRGVIIHTAYTQGYKLEALNTNAGKLRKEATAL